MTQSTFVKKLNRIKAGKAPTTNKPVEIIDDAVEMVGALEEWDREERNGRVYLTRK